MYYRGAKERNDTFLKASENFMKKIVFEMRSMSTRWERKSGDSKKWEKIRKKKLRCTERTKARFHCRIVVCVRLIIRRLCWVKIFIFHSTGNRET